MANLHDVEIVELDPLLYVALMDDAVKDVGLEEFQLTYPGETGADVSVAVLDSGIDLAHPFLRVQDSISTCGESVDLPGSHGTHCAGSIASRDTAFPGIAPGVRLINVKVLRSNGTGQYSFITAGVDAALDREAEVLSLSLGFNHLPHWSDGGHGWSCPDGACPLCTAVDNAVRLDNRVVVVAAGNEHARAEALRRQGHGAQIPTELGCPGQARNVLTVGAVTKNTFLPASFTSHGPTAFGIRKPDLCAPGVNITSTIPVPRDSQGNPLPHPARHELFARKSGTSMATPIVAGAAALLIGLAKREGRQWNGQIIKDQLMNRAVTPLPFLPTEVGNGIIDLRLL